MSVVDSLWSDEEIKDAVIAYKAMQNEIALGNRVVKSEVYKSLSRKWGRSENSYERRMSNISAVLSLHGRSWIKGLKPLANVGTNVIAVIEKFLNEQDGEGDISSATFELEVAKKFKVYGIPTGILVDSKGIIVFRGNSLPGDTDIEKVLPKKKSNK